MQPAQTAPCLFPLRTEGAQQEYRSIAEALTRAGVMDVHNHRLLSSYVAQLDTEAKTKAAGAASSLCPPRVTSREKGQRAPQSAPVFAPPA